MKSMEHDVFNNVKYKIKMEKITLNITRDKSFIGAAMSYRINLNGTEIGLLRVGESISIEIDSADNLSLSASMVGNAISIHKIEKEILLQPKFCKTKVIDCLIRTKFNIIGFLTLGLLSAIGNTEIRVMYN